MDKIKVFIICFLWFVFLFILKDHSLSFLSENSMFFLMNATNWLLSLVSILSTIMIIFGLMGYLWNNYKKNKEKKQKFEEMFICGIIIFITAMISYMSVIIVHIDYIPY